MLRKGQRFELGGAKWRVVYVNQSRAHCVSAETRTVTVHDRKSDTDRTFVATSSRSMDISPNTPLELLKELN